MSVTPNRASRTMSVAGNVLVTATSVTVDASRPARAQASAMRARTRARLPASSADRAWSGSILEEVGHVDVVEQHPPALAGRATVVGGAAGGVRRRSGPRHPLGPVGRLVRRLAAVEAGGDDGDPDLVPERVVDDRAEDDVRVRVGGVGDELGGIVDLEQAEVRAAGDGQQ